MSFTMSPEELASNEHVSNLVKNGGAMMLGPCGHRIKLVHASKNGKRRHFFSHFSQFQTKKCQYIEKYREGGGESLEHINTKKNFQNTQTIQQLCIGCPRPTWCMNIDPTWSYTTEVRINIGNGDYIIVDGIFRDRDENVVLIVEIKHTHGTEGNKRTWLLTQSFEYIEAHCGSAQIVNVIDSKHEVRFCDECTHERIRIQNVQRCLKERKEKAEMLQNEWRRKYQEKNAEEETKKRKEREEPQRNMGLEWLEVIGKREEPRLEKEQEIKKNNEEQRLEKEQNERKITTKNNHNPLSIFRDNITKNYGYGLAHLHFK